MKLTEFLVIGITTWKLWTPGDWFWVCKYNPSIGSIAFLGPGIGAGRGVFPSLSLRLATTTKIFQPASLLSTTECERLKTQRQDILSTLH